MSALSLAIIAGHPDMNSEKGEITLLLDRLSHGDRSAEEELMPQVFAELHRLASSRLRGERDGHTLQATALVNEAYLRLCGSAPVNWQDRAHFFRVAARLMRRILVDYARQHNALKRSGRTQAVPLDEAICFSTDQSATLLEIDEVLKRLAAISPRQAQVVEMRFFADLEEEEIAAAIGRNVRTVRRDWLMARAWLHEQLKQA
jgi:RNA polymerase sigma-70 factor, ECF subfamily